MNLSDPALTAAQVCAALGLQPHPEGGHYRELWRDAPATGRGAASTILFLLAENERSHLHRVDAAELWLWHAGAPLRLGIAPPDGAQHDVMLGPDLGAGHSLQAVVPKDAWQAAESLGRWSLVGCVVAPAFQFEGFTLAAPGWQPGSPATR